MSAVPRRGRGRKEGVVDGSGRRKQGRNVPGTEGVIIGEDLRQIDKVARKLRI